MIGIGSESGFLSASKCLIGNTNSQDYHSEMNAKHFLEWFQEVLDLVPDKSVIVFDQASYHRTKTEESRNPTTLWRKANVIQWLLNHGVSIPEEYESFHKMTLPVLRQLARLHRVEEIYIIEDMAKKSKKDEDFVASSSSLRVKSNRTYMVNHQTQASINLQFYLLESKYFFIFIFRERWIAE
jgi:hypothetical protein